MEFRNSSCSKEVQLRHCIQLDYSARGIHTLQAKFKTCTWCHQREILMLHVSEPGVRNLEEMRVRVCSQKGCFCQQAATPWISKAETSEHHWKKFVCLKVANLSEKLVFSQHELLTEIWYQTWMTNILTQYGKCHFLISRRLQHSTPSELRVQSTHLWKYTHSYESQLSLLNRQLSCMQHLAPATREVAWDRFYTVSSST